MGAYWCADLMTFSACTFWIQQPRKDVWVFLFIFFSQNQLEQPCMHIHMFFSIHIPNWNNLFTGLKTSHIQLTSFYAHNWRALESVNEFGFKCVSERKMNTQCPQQPLIHLSLFLSFTQASNNIIPLGTDKCGSCDKELGERTMQSFSISSHCQGSSDPLVDMHINSIDVW